MPLLNSRLSVCFAFWVSLPCVSTSTCGPIEAWLPCSCSASCQAANFINNWFNLEPPGCDLTPLPSKISQPAVCFSPHHVMIKASVSENPEHGRHTIYPSPFLPCVRFVDQMKAAMGVKHLTVAFAAVDEQIMNLHSTILYHTMSVCGRIYNCTSFSETQWTVLFLALCSNSVSCLQTPPCETHCFFQQNKALSSSESVSGPDADVDEHESTFYQTIPYHTIPCLCVYVGMLSPAVVRASRVQMVCVYTAMAGASVLPQAPICTREAHCTLHMVLAHWISMISYHGCALHICTEQLHTAPCTLDIIIPHICHFFSTVTNFG